MKAEQLIFAIIAFALFIYMFYKMIKENETSYVILLILQAFGILLNFIEIIDILKAKIFLKLGDNKNAKQALIHLVTKYPENYKGHKMLAEIYEDEGGMRKAIDEYVQAIDIHKRDYDSYYKIAELLTNLDKQDEAAQMLNNLLRKKPDYYQATVLLGEILINKEMYKEAANVYHEGLRYNPTSYDLNYNLGLVYTMLNDFENAKICYEKAAEINSLLYNAKYALAEIALIYKEIEEAREYFLQATESEELAPDAYYELAKIEIIKGNKETAIQYANTAIDLNSKKIVPKVKSDPVFIPIIARLTLPFNLEMASMKQDNDEEYNKEKKQEKLSEKELKAKEHLEETFEITKNISYADIEIRNRNGRNMER